MPAIRLIHRGLPTMSEYQPPLNTIRFILFDVFQVDKYWQRMDAFKETIDRETADAMLEEAGKLASQVLYPINRSGDEEGVTFSDGDVTLPAGFKEAYAAYAEGGWNGFSGNPEFDGLGMPKALGAQIDGIFFAANSAFALTPSLTSGACLALDAHASQEMKQLYLPKLYAGIWSGSMCLTESHAGSDLGLIRTKAVANDDGCYSISGTKIFISAGEHDLSENIIHLVLAKLPDAPEGPKGISLFVVPKVMVGADGQLGERNSVSCGSIEHKMGIKASPTCVMNFDGAKGYLVGELNRGLSYMFTMMNYERLTIGVQGMASSELSYQSALEYAKDRRQGRAVGGAKEPDKSADTLLVHADVKRMLLTMKSLVEAGRALAAYAGMYLDISKYADNTAEKTNAVERVALLTPVVKAFMTDMGFDTAVLGQQIFGGHGYIREWGQEQLVRDIRITQIYEGTNGIQAHDLLGRKVLADKGKALGLFVDEIRMTISECSDVQIKPLSDVLGAALATLESVSTCVIELSEKDPNEIGAAAVEYLHLLGYIVYGYMWLKMAKTASGKDDAFCVSKLRTAEFYFQRIMPRIAGLSASIKAGFGPINVPDQLL